MTDLTKKIRVLVVDDSAIFRQILKEGLTKDPRIEVIATASDPYEARDKIIEYRPDVMTLDVEMPRMDGVNFLQKLMPQYPLPVVMVSSLTQRGKEVTLAALSAGAVDFVTKPTSTVKDSLAIFITTLVEKVKMASIANVSKWKVSTQKPSTTQSPATLSGDLSLKFKSNIFIAMGASTGGTEALRTIITSLPKVTPGIVVVQHMPAGFTKLYADGLNAIAEMEVLEGETGMAIIPGRVIIAPGGKQMTVQKSGGSYTVSCDATEKVNGHAPSVDVLFSSLAKEMPKNVVLAVILTGMGKDGANGMLELKQMGVHTIAQDENSCVVYGMPKAAVEIGATHEVLPLNDIATALLKRSRG